MTDTVRLILVSVARGFKDSLWGTLKLYHMDVCPEDETRGSPKKQTTEHLSTLARRRAERVKQRETKKDSEPKVLNRVLLCCAWNGGLFWLSILVFNGILLPSLKFLTHFIFGGSSTHSLLWSWMGPMLYWTFGALWILPLFVLSKVVNSLWFQDIADAAYRKSRGRPQLLPSLSKIIADILFSLLLQGLFLIQGMLASLLPIAGIGQAVSLLHMCLLYSLYAFEYKWFNMGWGVHKRLSYLELNWPYFVGFGLPLAILTALPSSYIISGCVFSILFPLFIISGNEAEPIQEPCEFPLRLFSVVVSISNSVFHHSVKKTKPPSAKTDPVSMATGPGSKHTTMTDTSMR